MAAAAGGTQTLSLRAVPTGTQLMSIESLSINSQIPVQLAQRIEAGQSGPWSGIVQTAHGPMSVSVELMRVANPHGGASEITNISIQRAPAGAQANWELAELPVPAEHVQHAANWLSFQGPINGLPPKTVVISHNPDNGVAYVARWHGTEAAGSGRLSEMDVFTGGGWQSLPRAILDQVPSDRLTQVTRSNATWIEQRQLPGSGAAYWDVGYRNDAGQVVHLRFDGQGTLGLREVHDSDPGAGRVVSFGPAAAFFRNAGAITMPEGGRLLITDGGAHVTNAAGNIRTDWVLTASGEYQQVRTVEHVFLDGQGSDWRLITDHRSDSIWLQRSEDSGLLGEPIALGGSRESGLSIPFSETTEALDGQHLRSASGVSLSLSREQAGTDALGVVSYSVPLRSSSIPNSVRETVETRAGYTDSANAPWTLRTVELDSDLMAPLGIERFRDLGNGRVRAELEVLDIRDRGDGFMLRDGTEVIAFTNSSITGINDQPLLVVGSVNTQSRAEASLLVSELSEPGMMVLPSMGQPAAELFPALARAGLEPVAILGTGFIYHNQPTGTDLNGQPIETRGVGFQYINPTALGGADRDLGDLPAQATISPDVGGRIRAGYWIDTDGRLQLLDFGDPAQPGAPSAAAVQEELRQMMERDDVVAINLFSHRAASQPEALAIGGSPYPDAVEPTRVTESRMMMVFDDSGQYVGSLRTPTIAMVDTVTVAQDVFGDRAAFVLNGDGDFYTQHWFADGREGSDRHALGYENAMIVVRPTQDGSSVDLPDSSRRSRTDELRYGLGRVVDRITDVRDWIERLLPGQGGRD